MQSKILSYILNHPEESLKIDDDIFSNESLRKIFCVIKERQMAGKAMILDKICKEALTYHSISDLVNMQNEKVDKAEYKEYLSDIEYNNKLNNFDLLFSDYFEKFAKADKKDKLKVLIELKEKLQHSDTSEKNYEIFGTEVFDQWLDKYDKPVEYVAKTGIWGLDRAMGGFRGSELCVIVADTGIGKTNLMLNMCASMLKQKKSVLFFSLEMGVDELIDRLVPIIGGHNVWEIKERAVRKEMLGQTITEIKGMNIKIISSGFITSNDVISEAINHNPDIIMLDYLQLLNDDKGKDNETERLRQITLNLKRGALNLHKPIITPSQIDKASSKSGSIKIENVASSKEIANSADIGLYLYEKELKLENMLEEVKYETRLRLVKSRHSAKGLDIKINFDKQTLRMTDSQADEKEILQMIDF